MCSARAVVLANILAFSVVVPGLAQTSGVLREVFTGIDGNAVADLTNNPAYPGSPSEASILPDFEAPVNWGETFGQRLQALLKPTVSGTYYFYIASDDNSHLYLSTDATPASRQLIAYVGGWTGSRAYLNNASQKSGPVNLVAGQSYYIEAIAKEGGGGDNLAVTWQIPGAASVENGDAPIPGIYLQPYGLGPPVFAVQPANISAVENTSATFAVDLTRNLGATFQWLRDGTNVSGATQKSYTISNLKLTDSGAVVSCLAANSYGSSNSRPAVLTVYADVTPPSILRAATFGDPRFITVYFSERVESSSATRLQNYSLNNGVSVLAADLLEDAQTLVLQVSPLTPSASYQLSYSGIRDLAQTPNTIVPGSRAINFTYAPLDVALITGTNEPAGPSSRATGLIISEIMYHPADRADGKNAEFLELYNSNPWAEDLSGYRISGDCDYVFPAGTIIPALSYRVIAPNPADVQEIYGYSLVWGPLTNGNPGNTTNVLDNGGGRIRLRDELDSVLWQVDYDDEGAWPIAADGAGHSLVLARPSYGEANPKAWAASDRVGGSPGFYDIPQSNPYRSVLVNEVLSHTDDPQLDFVELFNYSSSDVDISGCIITDDPATNRFVIPAGTVLASRSFKAFDQVQLGFGLSADGEKIYLKSPSADRVIDAWESPPQQNGVSMGRYPDGAAGFHPLQQPTLGAANAPLRISQVVLNELMYHPVSENDDEEFVELFNRGSTTIDLSRWRLRGGISYNVPSGTSIGPGGYVVIARNRTNLLAVHPGLGSTALLGDFSGKLGNGGDTVRLLMPDQLVSTNQSGQRITNNIYIPVDSVTYGTGKRWGGLADGGGSSLELIDPRSDHRFGPNWEASDETAKSGWVTVETAGLLDNGGMASAGQLHITLLGPGECLVDNVEVIPQGGNNLVANSTFESGTSGWFFQGTHQDSRWETQQGFGSSRSLRVVASDRGDTGANRIRVGLNSTINSGTTCTLRARVKWLKGHPEILLRLHGNWLEAAGNTLSTASLGSPGGRNSRFQTNAGPAITEVTHYPILPGSGQSVTVVAQVSDPDAIVSAVVKFRADPEVAYTNFPMVYRGAGLFAAVIPGRTSGTLGAFYIETVDAGLPRATSRFPANAPESECLVRWGEPTPAGNFATYRLWVTQTNVTRWSTREKNSNHPLDATFVLGNTRVFYAAGTLYSGSPWHTPGYNSPAGALCDYEVNFDKDDLLLGNDDFVLATMGNLNNDGTYQAEQLGLWLGRRLGTPYLYRRYIRMMFNGQQRAALYEDAQQPNRNVVTQWFPDDDDGDLHKIEDWFEFNDSGDGKLGNVDATLQNFTTSGGVKKVARYRWCWRPRGVRESASNFTNLFHLVDAMNADQPEPYRSRVLDLVDVENFVRVLAMERVVGNWDSYGYSRGKNMYAYKPASGGWMLMPWDVDFVMSSGGRTPTDPLFGGQDPLINKLMSFPEFQRAYWRALQDAAYGPLDPVAINARVTARYNALVANGLSPASPQPLRDYAAQRRDFILSELSTLNPSFSITTSTSFTTNRNLVRITGTAPVNAHTLLINGFPVSVTWTGVNTWELNYALGAGNNSLVFSAIDLQGQIVPGVSGTVNINYTGIVEDPKDKLVINEIMYNPAVPDAGFLEIFNISASNAFDLSGWRIEGLDCDIPPGTIILPGGFLVFVKDRTVFAQTYGTQIPVAGVYDGAFDKGGENIRLVRPGLTPEADILIDQVKYDDDLPWPALADGTGPSLQLVNAWRDNNRVANWRAVSAAPGSASVTLVPITNQWRYQQTANLDGVNWMSPGYNDTAWPEGRGLLYNENSSLPAPKSTQLTLGRMTYYFRTYFQFSEEPGSVGLRLRTVLDDGAVVYLNGSLVFALRMNTNSFSYSTGSSASVGNAAYEGPFAIPADSLVQGTNVLAVEVHQTDVGSTDVVWGGELTTDPAPPRFAYTPGTTNSVAGALPEFPAVWLNEVLPHNVEGLTDRFGDRDPWVEVYCGNTNSLTTAGLFLSDSYTNLTRWPLPLVAITNRQFLTVWVDGEPAESNASEWHANFRVPANTGSVVLSWSNNGVVRVLDYLNYNIASAGRSYGDYPDGNVSGRQNFTIITPGATNNPLGAPLELFINEWMADNLNGLRDPDDDDGEDWFELYNPGDKALSLAGYYLTDELTNKTKWLIPENTIVPANGYLLVWADGEPEQNSYGTDLHADFSLSKGGEAIGLYGPGGVLVDAVTFGGQTTDISQGRFPNGAANIYYFTNTTPRLPNVLPLPNNPPSLAPVSDKIVFEGALLTFIAEGSDSDPGQTLTYALAPGFPAGAVVEPSSGVFSWIPDEAQGPGDYPITLTVSDNGVPPMAVAVNFKVQVNESNNPPVLTVVDNVRSGESNLISFTLSGADADEPKQTLLYSINSGLQPGMMLNPASGVFTWIPGEEQGPGTYFLTLMVTDDGEPAAFATQPLTITVDEVNTPPVLQVVSTVATHAGWPLQFTASAIDLDFPANQLLFSLVGDVPNGASIDPQTGLFQWTPDLPSTNSVSVQVSDGLPEGTSLQVVNLWVRQISITDAWVDGTKIRLTWDSVPGMQYTIETSTGLGLPWAPFGISELSGSWSTSFTNSLPVSEQGLFRIRLEND